MSTKPEQRAAWRTVLARRRHERAEVRRFTKRRRRRSLGLGIVASVAGLLIGVLAIAVFTPLMSVRVITVEGTERLTAQEVVQALQPLNGKPLAQVSNTDVASLLEPFVLIQSYSVQRTPPSELVVRIVEREPIGIYQQAGKQTVVDAAGVVLWQVGTADDLGEGMSLPVLESGAIGSPEFLAAGRVSLALPADFRSQVTKITATTSQDVTLQLASGQTVLWGSVDESLQKVTVLRALMTATANTSVSTYDVSSPQTPVTR